MGPAGNLLSIQRQASTAVSVIQLAPASAPPGAVVRIYGTGFSPTASNDSVSFGGTQATITSASTSELTATVPNGAATGTVTVTAPGGTANSPFPFTVTGSRQPAISSVSASVAAPESQLTVTGTHFDTTATDDTLTVGAARAAISAATATTMTWTVPASAASGPVQVATPDGQATGPDLFVPPTGYSASSVVQTTRMALGDTRQVSLGTSGGIAMLIFSATAGQQVFVNLTGNTFSGGLMALYDPSNQQMTNTYLSGYIDTTPLPVTGTYTLLLAPGSTGSATVTLDDADDATYTVSPSQAGGAVAVTTSTPGQNAAITFSGTAGQKIFIAGSDWSYTGCVYLTVKNPDGSTLSGQNGFCGGSGYLDLTGTPLPQTGTYTVSADPYGTATGSGTFTFYQVPADGSYSVSPSQAGGAVAVATGTPGQNAAITFSGTAGQKIFIAGSDWSYTGCVYLTVKNPDGSTLSGQNGFCGGGGYLDLTGNAAAADRHLHRVR